MKSLISIKKELEDGIEKTEVLYKALSRPNLYSQEEVFNLMESMSDEELKNYKGREGSYLHQVSSRFNLKLVKYLLKRGLDVNCISGIMEGGSLIRTALIYAPSFTNTKVVNEEKLKEVREVIKTLLENGADVHYVLKLDVLNIPFPTIIELITKLVPIKDEEIVNMVKEYYYKDEYNENK